MKKRLFTTFIIILLFIGNNNYQELSDLAIITNIAITKENNNYEVIFQEILPIKEENKISKKYKKYKEKDKKLEKAFVNISNNSTKEFYLKHLENILINKDNINTINDLEKIFKDDFDNFNIILTDNNPEKILNYSTNYKHINSLIDGNCSFQNVKKSKLENKKIKLPIIKLDNNKLFLYKYIKLGW